MPKRTRDEEDRRQQLERIVNGALRDCINQHGPVTKGFIPSAGKRISAALISREIAANLPYEYEGAHRGVHLP